MNPPCIVSRLTSFPSAPRSADPLHEIQCFPYPGIYTASYPASDKPVNEQNFKLLAKRDIEVESLYKDTCWDAWKLLVNKSQNWINMKANYAKKNDVVQSSSFNPGPSFAAWSAREGQCCLILSLSSMPDISIWICVQSVDCPIQSYSSLMPRLHESAILRQFVEDKAYPIQTAVLRLQETSRLGVTYSTRPTKETALATIARASAISINLEERQSNFAPYPMWSCNFYHWDTNDGCLFYGFQVKKTFEGYEKLDTLDNVFCTASAAN